MHCELVVPPPPSAPRDSRRPALELLLARGRRTRSEAASTTQWLLEAFGDGVPGDETWLRAEPVHLRADRDRVLQFRPGSFAIARGEAEALCQAINGHFGARLNVSPLKPEVWNARSAIVDGLDSLRPPSGEAMELPHGGEAATVWHALLNEIQMVLHVHPVNAAREERGEPAVNGVWLWGAARLPRAASGPWQSVTADDPVALGLARLAGMRHHLLPRSAGEWLDRLPQEGRHLAVLDSIRDEAWFAPLLAALREGRVGMITLHLPEWGLAAEAVRGDLRRFWRRPRPLDAHR